MAIAHLTKKQVTADHLTMRALLQKFNMADLKGMIAQLLINICRKLSDGNLRQDVLDHVYYTIERVEHILTLCRQIMYIDGRIFPLLSEAKLLIWHEDQLQENSDINYQSSSSHDGN